MDVWDFCQMNTCSKASSHKINLCQELKQPFAILDDSLPELNVLLGLNFFKRKRALFLSLPEVFTHP